MIGDPTGQSETRPRSPANRWTQTPRLTRASLQTPRFPKTEVATTASGSTNHQLRSRPPLRPLSPRPHARTRRFFAPARGQSAHSVHELLYPLLTAYDRGPPVGCGNRCHRAKIQFARPPRHPRRVRPSLGSSADDADPRRPRRPPQNV